MGSLHHAALHLPSKGTALGAELFWAVVERRQAAVTPKVDGLVAHCGWMFM
jgi:hypothetical protein